jgi:hypothetical protein
MKQHDLKPDLTIYPEDAAGVADLTQVVSWRLIGKLRGVVVVEDPAPTVTVDPGNHARATLVHTWILGETSTLGDMRVEAEAMWPGNKPQTFPAEGFVTVRFVADLD